MFHRRRFVNSIMCKHVFSLSSSYLHAYFRDGILPTLIPRRHFQIAIVGGLNPTAQTLSLLLREQPLITRLSLFDVPKSTRGVSLDLSHIPSGSSVEFEVNNMEAALGNCDIAILAGTGEKKLDQTDYDLFKDNTEYIYQSATAVCKYCPEAFIVNLIEPINYTVPFVSEVMRSCNVYNRKKFMGVTGRDGIRAQACLHALYKIPEDKLITVPVICGHSSKTSVPLLSHVTPWFNIEKFAAVLITENVRGAEKQVLKLKGGEGQSSLSKAYAGLWAVSSILKALNGTPTKLIALVENNEYETKYFTCPVTVTKNGIRNVAGYKVFSTLEAAYLQDATKVLAQEVKEAEKYFRDINDEQILA